MGSLKKAYVGLLMSSTETIALD